MKVKYTSKSFLAKLEEINDRNLEMARRKNGDYANDDNPFQNFKVAESFGISVEAALLVRMSDKMSRISNLIKRPALVADESILDTCSDLANYATILRAYLEYKHDNS